MRRARFSILQILQISPRGKIFNREERKDIAEFAEKYVIYDHKKSLRLKSFPVRGRIAAFDYTFPSLATEPQTTEAKPELARDLNVSQSTALVVCNILGNDMFA